MADDKEMKEKADKLFELLSSKDISKENQEAVVAIIKENPGLLVSKEFMERMAPLNMNKCPDNGVDSYVQQSSEQLKKVGNVLENLDALHKADKIGKMPGGKTPVQYVIDNGSLPNGEILGTQVVKNIIYLRALQNDEQYADNAGLQQYLTDNEALLGKMYKKNEYAANPNRRNFVGQKVGELIESHMDKHSDTRSLKVDALRDSPAQKNLSREELETALYRGTITAEQKALLDNKKKEEKAADVKAQPGDVQRSNREKSNDKFKDEDVIKYMYEDWLLGGASWLFNKVEDFTLGVVDSGCDIFVESCKKRGKLKKELEEVADKARNRVSDFGDIYTAVRKGRNEAYDKKTENYTSIFDELGKVIADPDYKPTHNFDPSFIAKLRADPKAAEFIKAGEARIAGQIKTLKIVDDIALTMKSVEMTNQMMLDPKAWLNADGKPKTQAELQTELEHGSIAYQKKMMKAIAIITEDARLKAEMAYERLTGDKPDFNDFVQNCINADVNKFIQDVSKQVNKAAKQQGKEVEAGNFKDRGSKTGPSEQVTTHLSAAVRLIDETIERGTIYTAAEFTTEKSDRRVAATCSLYEEAKAQNIPSVFEKLDELRSYHQETLDSRKSDMDARRRHLEQMKAKIIGRDGQRPVERQINRYVKNQGRK